MPPSPDLCHHNAAIAKGEKLTTVNQKGAAIVEEMAVVVAAAAAAGSTSATMAIVSGNSSA